MASAPYKLSCALYGHNLDVRAVATTSDGRIVSGSRDRTAKVWVPNECQSGYRESRSLSCHNNFVSCVFVLPSSKRFPAGLIITGSNDHCIRLFDDASPSPISVLKAHTNTVCKIASGISEDTIVSSSWDQTGKVWDLGSCKDVATLSGHEAAVWSVVQLASGAVVTASADKKMKVWTASGTCLRTLVGHTDCVRDVADLGDGGGGGAMVVSVSNDATVRVWAVDTGHCVRTLYGHSNFIYTVSVMGPSMFATGSEDRCVKVWSCSSWEVQQTIALPADSVWCLGALPNGDLVAATSDGVVRVFSADSTRQAAPDQLAAFQEQVNALTAASKQLIGDMKVSDLPGPEALYEPGKTDGQTKMVREDGEVVAYSWSSAEGRWDKIGQVMGGGSGGQAEGEGVMHNGKRYDYVFSVDIEEGRPPLKLPFNKGDDPWVAAQAFIHTHNLSQQFLEQVANFIVVNAEPSAPAPPPSADYMDPFTGGARYIPSTGGVANGASGTNSDPFTGSSSYTSGTAATKYSAANVESTYFPQREFLRFDQANTTAISEKLLLLSQELKEASLRVTEDEVKTLMTLCAVDTPCTAQSILVLDRLLNWPQDIVFPVLDTMRLVIRNTEANSFLCTDNLIPTLSKYLSPHAVPPNNMLTLRVLCNMLTAEPGIALATDRRIHLLGLLREVAAPYTKPLQVAMATLLLNMAVVLRRAETPDGRSDALSVAQDLLPKLTDEEALFRALVALGTLLADCLDRHRYSGAFRPLAVKYGADEAYGARVRECARHILQLL